MDKIKCIDPEMTILKLEEIANNNGIPFDNTNKSLLWHLFAVDYGVNHNLTKSEALSFGYVVSALMTNQGFTAGTNKFFNENKILVEIIEEYQKNQIDGLSENAKLKLLFHQIYEFYSNSLEEYTYKTEKLNVRLTLPDKERLMGVPGKNKTEKIHNLIKNFK